MRSDSEHRRFRRSSASRTQTRLLVNNSEVALVNFSSGGLRVELVQALTRGEMVQVSGELEGSAGGTRVDGRRQVRWCAEVNHGMFHAGLSFESAGDVPAGAARMMLGNSVDYYEVLKVSRRADIHTIRRAYHLLAQRYHPDNLQTGSQELFGEIVQANEVLSDPAQRAAFDIQLASHDQNRLRLFEDWQSSREVQSEIRKRKAILRLLHDKRFADPDQQGIVLRDFENLMGCPREHLEFSFWVLRKSKLVTCGDGARYEITFQVWPQSSPKRWAVNRRRSPFIDSYFSSHVESEREAIPDWDDHWLDCFARDRFAVSTFWIRAGSGEWAGDSF